MRYIIATLFACSAFGQGGFNGAGSYEIRNIKSGKVLDLDRNDQTTVIQYSSGGSDNQMWYFQDAGRGWYYLRNGMNGNALTATQNNNAAPVQGLPYNGSPSQQWSVQAGKDGNAMIVSRNGKTLDIPDGTDRDGVRVQIYDRNGDSNQRFTLRQVGPGNNNRGNRPAWMGGQGRDSDGRGNYGNSGDNRARGGGGGGNNNSGVQTITCSSDDGRRHNCQVDTRGGVQLTRQISGSACTQGQTWGYDGNGIWVDRGCRAEFQTGNQPRRR